MVLGMIRDSEVTNDQFSLTDVNSDNIITILDIINLVDIILQN